MVIARQTKGGAVSIRVGVGGWTFEPWRGVFYPPGLAQAQELDYASRHLTSIEINGTYYGSQSPQTFRKWRDATPEGFVFSVKGSRFVTNRRVLAEAGEAIQRFIDQGLLELEDRLGPLLWQFAPTKKFDRDDIAAFLDLLPATAGGRTLRHVVEARHDSFCTPQFGRPSASAKYRRGPCRARDLSANRRRDGRFRLRPPAEGLGRR